MVSENKKSNQAAGEGYRYCRRSHWLSALGTLLGLEIPDGLRDSTKNFIDLAKFYGSCVRHDLTNIPCDCSNCQRRPRRSDDRNPHEGKVML